MLIKKVALMLERRNRIQWRKLMHFLTHLLLCPVTSASTPHPKSLLNRYCASEAAHYTLASSICDKASRNIANFCSNGLLFSLMPYTCSLSLRFFFGHALLTPQFIQIWVACAAVFTFFSFFHDICIYGV